MDHYTAYGLRVQSDIDLSELLPASAAGEAQVTVRRAALAEPRAPTAQSGRSFRATPGGILLDWPAYGRFLVSQGSHILVEPAAGAHEAVIRHLLIGPVFSVLNYQRGLAIFHASAVALTAGGVAFMAPKGYGKSTQAAAFLQHGGSLITDDLLALRVEQGAVWMEPGVPFLKLWPETISHLGGDPEAHPLVKDHLLKRTSDQSARFVTQPTVLRAVFLLDHGPRVELQPLSPREGLLRLLAHWYGALFDGDLLPVLGIERQFMDCTALAERVPIYRIKRPVALDQLAHICQVVECVL